MHTRSISTYHPFMLATQFSHYMTAPETADLIAAYRFSDRDFDAWVQQRDTAANRTFKCAPKDLKGLVGSCWCNASVPSGDICNAIMSMSQLPNLHSQPETIGRLLRRQGAVGSSSKRRMHASSRSSLGQEEILLPPKTFPFPWRDFPGDGNLEPNFLELLCPSEFENWPCVSLTQCSREPEPVEKPSAPPDAFPAPPTPSPPAPSPPSPPSADPYKCKRDKGKFFTTCSSFNIKDGEAKVSALRDLVEMGCGIMKSCKTTTFSSAGSPGIGFLPIIAKFKVRHDWHILLRFKHYRTLTSPYMSPPIYL
jgi:hypothetical protein